MKTTAETQRTQSNAEEKRGEDQSPISLRALLCDLRASAVKDLAVPVNSSGGYEMESGSMEPYASALVDFFNGDASAKFMIHRDDRQRLDEVPVAVFFQEPTDFPPLEQTALELCYGNVLDIGAGAGRHSLALQESGLSVCAIDISSKVVEIMQKRGVKDARCISIFDFEEGPFDTLLIMMHGIGMVETLDGLKRFLEHAHKLVKPDGQILLDSLDVRCTDDPVHLAYHERNRQAGRYFGEMHLQFEYKGQKGQPLIWLHVDPETLANSASEAGWRCQIIYQEEGNYLARLTPDL
jgi:2-polyprenyl-3-methyl-5-hydroxy-6-metoxy-1,4-benzoquinol methylase